MIDRSRIRFAALVVVVGVLGGLIGVIFHYILALVVTVLYGQGDIVVTAATLPVWWIILLPALGGLAVGVLMQITNTPEVAGEGVPAIRQVLLREQSKVRYRVGVMKAAVTVLTLGTGGSGGREGPIIQIGAAMGAAVGQWQSVSVGDRHTLLLAGAASAMATTFGTPAAALVFIVEVLRQPLSWRRQLVLIGAVGAAWLVSRVGFGFTGLALPMTSVASVSPYEMAGAAMLGVVAGLVAVVFTKTLSMSRHGFQSLPFPVWIKPALGGLGVGVLCVWLPYLYEPAFYAFGLRLTFDMTFGWMFLLLLIVAKIVATALTVGSGGSGGIFAPALFLGLIVGALVESMWTAAGMAPSPQFLLVGMAALFAGAAHAPFTAVFMLYELTDEIVLIPSLAIAATTAYMVARLISREHMYSADE